MPFTKYAVDTFISDKVTGVTECMLADLYAEFPDAKKLGLGIWVDGDF